MRVFEQKEVIDPAEQVTINKHMHSRAEPMHSHEFWEIAYIYNGCGYQLINGKEFFVKHGDLMVFSLNDRHSFMPEGDMGVYNCILTPRFLSENIANSENAIDILSLTSFSAFKLDNIETVIHFDCKVLMDIENIFEAMEREFNRKELGYTMIIHNYVEILLAKIFRHQHLRQNINYNNEINRIAPDILKFISEHYDQKITLTELAQKSFYSPSYFSRVFKECFNKTLTDYIMEIRIGKAVQMLKETNFSVETIAHKTGYFDMKTFYAAFKKVTGCLPSKFRK